jgi:hypothetical protein
LFNFNPCFKTHGFTNGRSHWYRLLHEKVYNNNYLLTGTYIVNILRNSNWQCCCTSFAKMFMIYCEIKMFKTLKQVIYKRYLEIFFSESDMKRIKKLFSYMSKMKLSLKFNYVKCRCSINYLYLRFKRILWKKFNNLHKNVRTQNVHTHPLNNSIKY